MERIIIKFRVYFLTCSECRELIAKPSKGRKYLLKESNDILKSADFVSMDGTKLKLGDEIACKNRHIVPAMAITSKGDLPID